MTKKKQQPQFLQLPTAQQQQIKNRDEQLKSDGPDNSIPIEERLEEKGIFILDDVITSDLVRIAILNLLERNYEGINEEIQIFVNSPGGYSADAWALVDIIQMVSFPVKTVAIGRINSAAAVIVASGDKGNRYAMENTEIMIHQHSSYKEGQYNQLAASQIGEEKEYKRHLQFWMKHSKYKTEKSVIENIFCETDNYMTAEEAKKHGIIDHIVRSKKWK